MRRDPRSVANSFSMVGVGGDAVPTRKRKDVPKHVKDLLQKETLVQDVFEKVSTVQDFVGLQGAQPEKKVIKNELYVRGIPFDMDEEGLKQLFSKFKPRYARALKNEDLTKSLGFGFVRFQTAGLAREAMKAMDGMEIPKKDGGYTKIAVSPAFPRTERKTGRLLASVSCL